MQPFTYVRADTLEQALAEAAQPGAQVMAGGTTMVDLMRSEISAPSRLVDIGHLPGLDAIDTAGPVIRFGALARMADVAEDATLLRDYPALVQGLQLAASAQLRNAASVAGNVLQRTRCPYFRDGVSACNKRVPGSGCAALDGEDREMALFGGSERCIATYPGDWAAVLAALDSAIEVRSATGTRTVPFLEFHRPYGDDPAVETVLQPGEIVTAITVQATPLGRKSIYLKVRDRQSYAYAVVSAAVALEMDGDTVTQARVALGGVASTPWRSPEAEAALTGRGLTEAVALEAGEAAFAKAQPRRQNAFKIELGRRVVARAAMLASQRN